VKCLELLKKQEKRISTEFSRVFGADSLESEDSDNTDESTSLFRSHSEKRGKEELGRSSSPSKSFMQEQTESSTIIIDKRLQKIESDFKMVNSLYDDMDDLQKRQSGHIGTIGASLDTVLKKTELAREELKETLEYANQTKQSFGGKVVALLAGVISLVAFLRVMRG